MASQFVRPYVKTNKNDAAGAKVICEAVGRPNIRFVPVKNVEQQAVLAPHQVRQGCVRARTTQAHQIRELSGEFGLIVPQGIGHIATRAPKRIEDGGCLARSACSSSGCSITSRSWIARSRSSKARSTHGTAAATSAASWPWFLASGRSPPARWSRRSATPRTSTVAGRSRAWCGLVPRQHSSGGKSNLLGMSERGDTYSRTLLSHGARSVIYRVSQRADACSWINSVVNERGYGGARGQERSDSLGRCWRMTGTTPATCAAQRWSEPVQPATTTSGRTNHRLLRQAYSDGKTGPNVVGKARAGRGTQGTCKRSRRQPANPIRDSSPESCNQNPDVRVQSLPSSRHEFRAWHRGPCTAGRPILNPPDCPARMVSTRLTGRQHSRPQEALPSEP